MATNSKLTNTLPRFFIVFIFFILLGLTFLPEIGQMRIVGTYPVVDTGQIGCFNAQGQPLTCPDPGEVLYGQDAQYTGNMPNYTDNGDGTITDNITGLIWQQTTDTDGDGNINFDDKLTYPQADSYCQNLSLAGETDWQLPDIKQLYALIDFNGTDPSGYEETDTSNLIPFIDTNYFDFGYGDTTAGERVIDAQYASSTLYVANTANDGGQTLFGVNFADGRIKGYGLVIFQQDKTFYVMCVRENTIYGQNNFIDNADNTITDNATGLMWTKDDSALALNWTGALTWTQTQNQANYLGYNDWRLPDAKELQSIVDYTRSPETTSSAAIHPLFNTTVITNEAGEVDYPAYWSSTTHINWMMMSGPYGVYVSFGRAMGYIDNAWVDIHGAGAQRSDPKEGDPADFPTGHGPQNDAIRIYNYVRLVRDTEIITATPTVTPLPTDFVTGTPTPTSTITSTSTPTTTEPTAPPTHTPTLTSTPIPTSTPTQTATPTATTTPVLDFKNYIPLLQTSGTTL